jgi:hypothetical protein
MTDYDVLSYVLLCVGLAFVLLVLRSHLPAWSRFGLVLRALSRLRFRIKKR